MVAGMSKIEEKKTFIRLSIGAVRRLLSRVQPAVATGTVSHRFPCNIGALYHNGPCLYTVTCAPPDIVAALQPGCNGPAGVICERLPPLHPPSSPPAGFCAPAPVIANSAAVLYNRGCESGPRAVPRSVRTILAGRP